MKTFALAASLALTACATGAAPTQIETRDVVVTRTERAVTEQQVLSLTPPAPVGSRPGDLSSALDLMTAQMCDWVRYATRADPLLQHAAGMTPVQRVIEPVCQRQPVPR